MTDDEAALREAVRRCDTLKKSLLADAKWLRVVKTAPGHARRVKGDADALALVLRRVRETMKQEAR